MRECVVTLNAMASRRLDDIPSDFSLDLIDEQLSGRCKFRGYQLFVENYEFDEKFDASNSEETTISARCYRSMKKSLDALFLNVCFSTAFLLNPVFLLNI